MFVSLPAGSRNRTESSGLRRHSKKDGFRGVGHPRGIHNPLLYVYVAGWSLLRLRTRSNDPAVSRRSGRHGDVRARHVYQRGPSRPSPGLARLPRRTSLVTTAKLALELGLACAGSEPVGGFAHKSSAERHTKAPPCSSPSVSKTSSLRVPRGAASLGSHPPMREQLFRQEHNSAIDPPAQAEHRTAVTCSTHAQRKPRPDGDI